MPSPNDKQRFPAWLVILLALAIMVVIAVLLRGRIRLGGDLVVVDGNGQVSHGEVEWTRWLDGVELFVAHSYAIADQPFNLVIHATRQATGTALTSGSVKVSIAGQGGSFEEEVTNVSAPGIWEVPITPLPAGIYQVDIVIDSPDIEERVLKLSSEPLQVHASANGADTIAESSGEVTAGEVHFLKEQQWRIGLKTKELQHQSVAEQLVVPGKVVAPHGSETMVFPPVPGRVGPPPNGQFPHIGQSVEAGQVLAVIEPSIAGAQSVQLLVNQAQLRTLDIDLTAKQLDIATKLAAARTDLDFANQEVERLNSLSSTGSIAGRKQMEAEFRQKQAQAACEGYERSSKAYADAQQRLTRFLGGVGTNDEDNNESDSLTVVLRSPLAGEVVASETTAGEYVADDHLLYRVVNMQKLFIDAEVSEYDLGKIEGSHGAKFRLSAYPDQILRIYGPGKGRLVFIGAVVDPNSRTVTVRYEVPNDDGLLRLGMFADVMVEIGRQDNTIAVPQSAIIDDGGEPVVFVQKGGESFERRTVRLGLRDGDNVEIKHGLAVGERVVIEGAYAIRLSTLAGSVPEHHHH